MLNKYLKDVLNILEENCIGLIPCSKAEVDNLEHQVKSNLPVAYKEYLLSMGKYSGRFNVGTDCFYPDILDLGKYANDLLEENNTGLMLPSDAFVFSMHQGYQFNFFKLLDGDDPQVFSYSEVYKTPEFRRISESFSSYLLAELSVHGINSKFGK
ncbi:SMI1/KNR4 family protein [Dawidia soli]|uniref:SMI1/KNR4 family protein n=1 Tax=Dawidia soli TaxID=2782352 RepID=A0AAP2D9Z7_9BACT|nr:SMI1/KNR4 family protein [Dawidia soli]MBT1687191.1 SMI1/KNR4 family protein [Dawidia soli]